MELSNRAQVAETVWMHYADALASGIFKTDYHKKMLKQLEEYWREQYLQATENVAPAVLAEAGLKLITDSDGSYSAH